MAAKPTSHIEIFLTKYRKKRSNIRAIRVI